MTQAGDNALNKLDDPSTICPTTSVTNSGRSEQDHHRPQSGDIDVPATGSSSPKQPPENEQVADSWHVEWASDLDLRMKSVLSSLRARVAASNSQLRATKEENTRLRWELDTLKSSCTRPVEQQSDKTADRGSQSDDSHESMREKLDKAKRTIDLQQTAIRVWQKERNKHAEISYKYSERITAQDEQIKCLDQTILDQQYLLDQKEKTLQELQSESHEKPQVQTDAQSSIEEKLEISATKEELKALVKARDEEIVSLNEKLRKQAQDLETQTKEQTQQKTFIEEQTKYLRFFGDKLREVESESKMQQQTIKTQTSALTQLSDKLRAEEEHAQTIERTEKAFKTIKQFAIECRKAGVSAIFDPKAEDGVYFKEVSIPGLDELRSKLADSERGHQDLKEACMREGLFINIHEGRTTVINPQAEKLKELLKVQETQNSRLGGLDKALAKHQTERAALHKEVKELRYQNNMVHHQRDAARRGLSELMEACSEQRVKVNQDSHSGVWTVIVSNEQQPDESSKETVALESRVEILEGKLKDTQSEVENLQTECQELKQQNDELEESLDSLWRAVEAQGIGIDTDCDDDGENWRWIITIPESKETETLRQELAKANESLRDQSDLKTKVLGQMQICNDQLLTLQNNAKAEAEAAKVEMKELHDIIDKLKNQLWERDDKDNSQKAELRNAEESLLKHKKEAGEQHADMQTRIDQKIVEHEEAVEQLKEQHRLVIKRLSLRYQGLISARNDEHDESIRDLNNQHGAEMKVIKDETTRQQQILRTLKQRVHTLTAELAKERMETSALQYHMRHMRETMQNQDNKVRSLTKVLEERENQHVKDTNMRLELHKQLEERDDTHRRDVDTMKKQLEYVKVLKTEVETLEKESQRLAADLERAAMGRDEAKEHARLEKESYEQILEAMGDSLRKHHLLSVDLYGKNVTLRGQIKVLEGKIAVMKDEYDVVEWDEDLQEPETDQQVADRDAHGESSEDAPQQVEADRQTETGAEDEDFVEVEAEAEVVAGSNDL